VAVIESQEQSETTLCLSENRFKITATVKSNAKVAVAAIMSESKSWIGFLSELQLHHPTVQQRPKYFIPTGNK